MKTGTVYITKAHEPIAAFIMASRFKPHKDNHNAFKAQYVDSKYLILKQQWLN